MSIDLFLKQYDRLKPNEKQDLVKKLVSNFESQEEKISLTRDICDRFLEEIIKMIGGSNQIAQISGLQLLKSSCDHVKPFIGRTNRKSIINCIFKRIGDSKVNIRELANENFRKYSFLIDTNLFDYLANQTIITKNLSQKEYSLKFIDEFSQKNFSLENHKILKNLLSKCSTDSSFKIRELTEIIGKNIDRTKKIYASFRPAETLKLTTRENVMKRKLSNDTLDRTITPVKENFYSQKNSRQASPEPRKPISFNQNKKKAVCREDLQEMWINNTPCQIVNFKVAIPEISKINEMISKTSNDWMKRILAMKKLRGIVEKFSKTDPDQLASQLNKFLLAFSNSIKDLRSKVNIEIFSTIGFVASCMRDKNSALFENLLPVILPLFTSSPLPTTSSASSCLEIVLKFCRSSRILTILKDSFCNSKSVPIRRQSSSLYMIILEEWEIDFIEKNAQILESIIKIGITDADSEVRTTSSLVFWQYLKRLKKRAICLYSSLNDREKNILRDKCPSSVFDLQDSFNSSKIETASVHENSRREVEKTQISSIKEILKCTDSIKDNILLPKPLINQIEKCNISDCGKDSVTEAEWNNKENVDQTELDSSNLMYGPAGFTPFIPKIHSSDKSHKIKGDDLVLEMKFETLYIDLESNDTNSTIFALEKLASIFKSKSKIPIIYIPKLLISLEQLLLNDNEEVIIVALEVIILFVTSYHLEPFDRLASLMKNVLSLSKRKNFSEISTKIDQLIHVLQTVVNDEAIVKCFLDFFIKEPFQNSIQIINIFCNLLRNISEPEINNILEMVFLNISTNPEFQNILRKIAETNETIFQKFYDSLTLEKKKEISNIFTEKSINFSVLSDNITIRKPKCLSESDVDSIKKSILQSSTIKDSTQLIDLSKTNLEQLVLNLKEVMHNNSENENKDILSILNVLLKHKSAPISSNVSDILDIIGFYIEKGRDSLDFYNVIDSLTSLVSVNEIISSINPKLSVFNPSESQTTLHVLRYLLRKCDQKSYNMIEIIEVLPKLLRLWMSDSSVVCDISLDCLSMIHSIIGHDRFNLFTLSLPMEKKKTLYQYFMKKE